MLVNTIQIHAQQTPKAPAQDSFTYQPEIRIRGEERTTQDFSQTNYNDPHDLQMRLRLGLNWKSKEGWAIFLQPQYSLTDNHGSAKPTYTVHDLDIHQGFVDFKDANRKWRLGRQELVFGDQRLIGNGDWSAIGRSFDGARLTVGDRHSSTDLFLTKLGLAAPKTNEPLIAGVYSTVTRSPKLSYDLYAIYKSMAVTATTNQQIVTLGTRPRWTSGKRLDATLEAAYQFGTNEARPVSAWAYAAVAGYTLPGRVGLRISIERDEASGGNPTGTGAYRTFDQLFPTNHSHYGIIDYMGWKNMEDTRISLRGNPAPRLTAQVDGHFFALRDGHDFWYGDNGRPMVGANGLALRDPSGASGRDVGRELDFVLTYAPTKTYTVSGGYARFFPGSFVKNTNGGKADVSDWFYVQAHAKF
jgi:hypothetical protein